MKASSWLGVGLIGLGRHGMRYAKHLLDGVRSRQAGLAGLRLVAVSRRQEGPGRAFAREHALRFYRRARDLIRSDQVGAVVIVSPVATHARLALESIRSGKPVLVEKPFTASTEEARAVREAARRKKIPLMVAHTMRFEILVKTLQKRLRGGFALGLSIHHDPGWTIEPVRRSSKSEGGNLPSYLAHQDLVLGTGVHFFDLARFLLGREVGRVFCRIFRRKGIQTGCIALLEMAEPWNENRSLDVPPLLVQIHLTTGSGSRSERFEVIRKGERLVGERYANRLIRVQDGRQQALALPPWRPTVPLVLEEFARAVRTGRAPSVTATDGLRSVEIAEACTRSDRLGRWVSQ